MTDPDGLEEFLRPTYPVGLIMWARESTGPIESKENWMLTREVVLPKVAILVLMMATLTTAWPKAYATGRVSITETAEGTSAKKTKRKRAPHDAQRPALRTAHATRVMKSRWSAYREAQTEKQKRIGIALDAARGQLGKPYRWAGTGPGSFDCSGLTQFAWGAAGVNLPHNSSAQAAAVEPVPFGDLRAGDLIFSGSRRIGHVGIYIGQGQMIHAPQSGRTIEIAPLHSNLIGAGRPA